MKTYEIEYDGLPLATVEIDETKAAKPIKEMVEFWMGWERDLAKHDGDYTASWLHHLAKFILKADEPPQNNEEGWFPLDGSRGIKLVYWESWKHDDDLISIS